MLTHIHTESLFCSQRMSGWRLDIPELDKPQPVEPPTQPKVGFKTEKILHLSDPHVQRDYKVRAHYASIKCRCLVLT